MTTLTGPEVIKPYSVLRAQNPMPRSHIVLIHTEVATLSEYDIVLGLEHEKSKS